MLPVFIPDLQGSAGAHLTSATPFLIALPLLLSALSYLLLASAAGSVPWEAPANLPLLPVSSSII
jgi:hypothetical protein